MISIDEMTDLIAYIQPDIYCFEIEEDEKDISFRFYSFSMNVGIKDLKKELEQFAEEIKQELDTRKDVWIIVHAEPMYFGSKKG